MNKGAMLLDDLSAYVGRYVVMRPEEAAALALHTIHTHAIDAADFTPYLSVHSPTLRCGKTQLLEVVDLLVAKPWLTGRVTAASLVRRIDREHPTLLLDESDTTFQANSEYSQVLRGILNTGYERQGKYSICVPSHGDWATKDFSTFCPKVIAGIGKLPDTVEDRSIPIRLQRRLRSERCEKFRKRMVRPEAEALRRRAAEWAQRNIKWLAQAVPDMPDELNDRQQDVCEPLVAIADRAGGEWPDRARLDLVSLLTSRRLREESPAVSLLSDIRACFDEQAADRIRSEKLVNWLVANEASAWREYRGSRLTQASLARLLHPFEIAPRDIRFEGGIFKGYRRSSFEGAWARYLPTQKRKAC